jgi:hypothetical protein
VAHAGKVEQIGGGEWWLAAHAERLAHSYRLKAVKVASQV